MVPRERCTRYVSSVTYVCRGGLRDRSVASVLVVVLVSVLVLELVVVGVFVASVP